MAEKSSKTAARKRLKKKLFHMGLSMAKPLLLWSALLLLADGCALTGLIRTCNDGGFLPVLFWVLFTALTTTILLLITGVIYQLCSFKAKVAFHLLEDIRGLLRQTERTIYHHLEARQEKDFRRTVHLALENIANDKEQQKELLMQLQALSLPSLEQSSSTTEKQESHLERLTNFLNQSVDTFVYLQQIYHQLQELGLTVKSNDQQKETGTNNSPDNKQDNSNDDDNHNDHNDEIILQELLTEVNRLQEQLEKLHLAK
ncbi:MAG: hypothetical protein HFI72_05440 [Peptococcaceae bacterium]|nr:hypothetical protein [Peptococcaceae bacterium]